MKLCSLILYIIWFGAYDLSAYSKSSKVTQYNLPLVMSPDCDIGFNNNRKSVVLFDYKLKKAILYKINERKLVVDCKLAIENEILDWIATPNVQFLSLLNNDLLGYTQISSECNHGNEKQISIDKVYRGAIIGTNKIFIETKEQLLLVDNSGNVLNCAKKPQDFLIRHNVVHGNDEIVWLLATVSGSLMSIVNFENDSLRITNVDSLFKSLGYHIYCYLVGDETNLYLQVTNIVGSNKCIICPKVKCSNIYQIDIKNPISAKLLFKIRGNDILKAVDGSYFVFQRRKNIVIRKNP